MNSTIVVGDPERVCAFVSTLTAGGYFVYDLKKTKNNATYVLTYSNVAPGGSYLLMEDGSYLLLEDGGYIILE